jgi:uncharacterized phage protein gp47/JayE
MAIPLATLGPTVDANGISVPTYADILATLQSQYQSIFGSDVDLDPDSQDGEWLAIHATAINDINAQCVATYNQFSPATAVGVGLSSVVKINGLARQVATNSRVDIRCIGQAGVTVIGGIVGDALGHRVQLPNFIFPPGGDITITGTFIDLGALTAAPNTITRILTPTRGWQSVNNPFSATPGAPVETDAQLRQRQAQSTGNSAVTPPKALVGNVLALSGVAEVAFYENVTDVTDANGLPPHSISMVVSGGDAFLIAQTILNKKTEGANTYGTTTESVPDYAGVPNTVNFFRPTDVTIQVEVDLTALDGFSTTIENEIKAAIAAYINGLVIGADVIRSRIYVPANLSNSADGSTYDISNVKIGKNGGTLGTADIVIAFNEEATCVTTDVTFVVT